MLITLIAIGVVVPGIAYWIKRAMDRRELEQYSVTPEVLHAMLASNPGMLLFDVRLPLDLLVDSEIIPGARRVPPQEIIKNPSIIPQDREVIVY
ncbi:MAG TPA: rhodanese-like domain-containing protein, partial [Acidobacteriaceae bacterium]|nr:rhodanese-like domain-containing protein [Acidobacteriaceae bacterium]